MDHVAEGSPGGRARSSGRCPRWACCWPGASASRCQGWTRASTTDDLPPSVTAYLFGGGPGAARTVLDAIDSSLITVTSLTFSLTVVTLQLASSQNAVVTVDRTPAPCCGS